MKQQNKIVDIIRVIPIFHRNQYGIFLAEQKQIISTLIYIMSMWNGSLNDVSEHTIMLWQCIKGES